MSAEFVFPSLSQEQEKIADTIRQGELPDSFPAVNAIDDLKRDKDEDMNTMMSRQLVSMIFKDATAKNGMFGYISKKGISFLLDYFGENTRFLDPICGRGWICKGLREKGASCIASDRDLSVSLNAVTDIMTLDARESVRRFKSTSDVLILSWPEKDNTSDYEAALEWGSDKPILLYGEHGRSCNSNEFLERFHVTSYLESFPDLIAKPTIHTKISVGHFI